MGSQAANVSSPVLHACRDHEFRTFATLPIPNGSRRCNSLTWIIGYSSERPACPAQGCTRDGERMELSEVALTARSYVLVCTIGWLITHARWCRVTGIVVSDLHVRWAHTGLYPRGRALLASGGSPASTPHIVRGPGFAWRDSPVQGLYWR